MNSRRIPPGPNQESVWDYPRPPRIEPTDKLIVVEWNGIRLAETRRALRVLETSHPPVYYLPPADVRTEYLVPTNRRTFCEFKGMAHYWTVRIDEREVKEAAWCYPKPARGYEVLAGFLAFYAGKMDACYVNGERAQPQPGEFYGGWITADIVGPFKGGPGTHGW